MDNINESPKRKNIRLKGYDYSSVGSYFVTVCTKDKKRIFWNNVGAPIGRPQNEEIRLSHYGEIADEAIKNISCIYPMISVDKYVVMPNHIHLIVTINADGYGRPMGAPTLSTVINQMKGYVTKRIGFPVWQKLYHDYIIRGQADYDEIWQYIDENPLKWNLDCYY